MPRPRKNKTVRYVLPGGKRCPKGTPGATKVVEESENYVVTLAAHGRRETFNLGTPDRAQAVIEVNRLRRRLADEAAGVLTKEQDHARRPLAGALADFLDTLRAGGATPERLRQLEVRITTLAGLARWKTPADLDAGSCLAGLERLGKTGHRACLKKQGRGAETRNAYLRHVKQFSKWLAEDGRLGRDPLARVRPVSTAKDRRHDRRLPEDDEVARLLAAAEAGPVRCKMTGPQRALCYETAMATGLRSKEVRALGWEDFDLLKGVLVVKGAYTKNAKEAVLDLPPWLVERLLAWKAGGGELWGRLKRGAPGRMLKFDLGRAGVAYERGGLYLDFHSFRHWFVTRLGENPGVDPKTFTSLTRHGSIDLALRVYAKLRRQAARSAVHAMPRPGHTDQMSTG